MTLTLPQLTMDELQIGDVVHVAWSDSESIPGWINPEEIPDEELLCYSVGYLVMKGEKVIAVAASLDPINKHCCSMQTIPVCNVRGIEKFA
jgi:hypothetical protein